MADISIGIGDALPFLYERVRELFGKDANTQSVRDWIYRQVRIARADASAVQIIGMERPIPIKDIYQQTSLIVPSLDHRNAAPRNRTFWDLLTNNTSALIFAGAGWGKTTLLHYVYTHLLDSQDWTPFLFTLRRPTGVHDLHMFLDVVSRQIPKWLNGSKAVLLVDGYDEISIAERKQVSEDLQHFSTLNLGPMYLTCRTFYDVYDLKIYHVTLSGFNTQEQEQYAGTFAKLFGIDIDARRFIAELRAKGFSDFTARPILLALACILKTSALPSLPNDYLGLLERALDTLSFRWDEYRGLKRDSVLPLDGRHRISCLKRIAFEMPEIHAHEREILSTTQKYLSRLPWSDLDSRKLLTEIAQFFGILVPTVYDEWEFVHRTMYDFLAAKHWVESGQFDPSVVTEWNSRPAYAACLLTDATATITRSLKYGKSIYVLSECLANGAAFDSSSVAKAIIEYFRNRIAFNVTQDSSGAIRADFHKNDFFGVASVGLLEALLHITLAERNELYEALTAYCFAELLYRKASISPQFIARCVSLYDKGFLFDSYRIERGWTRVVFDEKLRTLSIIRVEDPRSFQEL